MALIKINGVAIPTPSSYSANIIDLSNAERNALGDMIIERIATKRKLELSWRKLNSSELSEILKAVNPVLFKVEYVDPLENKTKTGVFYCGDRKCNMMSYINSVPVYTDVAFNLI